MLAAAARAYSGPYPSWAAPTAEACHLVAQRLAAVHGWPHEKRRLNIPAVGCEERRSVLDSLVRTILSQNTTDKTSGRAFNTLKERFPEWEAVRRAPLEEVADAIRVGGLAEIKGQRIQAILNTLAEERGECSLEHLRRLPPAEVKAELARFKGVGAKTIACVLLFALEHDEFAVDTHVHEISKALAWVPSNCTRDQAYAHLNDRVPGELKFDLHVLLVNHGKQCPACAKAGSARAKAADPSACPLADLKPPRCQLQKAAAAGAKRRGGAGGKRGEGAAAAVKDEEGAVKEEADVEVASAAAGGEAVAVKEEEIEEVAAAGGDAVPGKRRRSSKASASSS